MPSILVHWNRSHDDAWAEFFAVDFDDPHFEGLEGVFVVWQGGSQPAAISVGLGALRKELKAQRSDPAIAAYRGKPLFVAWAKVEKIARAGVARFLYETLKPRTLMTVPSAAPIDVNLPGAAMSAPPGRGGAAPPQIYEDLLAPERRPSRRSSPSSPSSRSSSRRAKERPKAGFFGGPAGKQPTNEDKLVGDAVQMILQSALRVRASDIHLEPQEAHLRVRFRIDGILEEVLRVKNSLNLRVVSNIRVACSLDPEKGAGGKPEDGRVSVKIDGREADLRLSTFPTAFGRQGRAARDSSRDEDDAARGAGA